MENINQSNPLMCDFETGICEMPSPAGKNCSQIDTKQTKLIKVIYFTDPICSSCWGIEPQLRKLKLEYGSILDVEYRMGGLLPDWSYNSGGISKPADVATHWDEASLYYNMPIDGDVWLEDPMHSSYPPSIAFKAAQMQDEEKAVRFLRELREMLFLQKKNIAKWENMAIASEKAGLNTDQLKQDYEGKAKERFNEDLELAQELGVRGFPTMFFVDSSGKKERVFGSKPYSVYENAIAKLHPSASKNPYETDWSSLFSTYATLTSREFSELSGVTRKDSDTFLQKLYETGQLQKLETKNGVLWKR